jgi:hypothetical protein
MRFAAGRAHLPGHRTTPPALAAGPVPVAHPVVQPRRRARKERTGTEPSTALSDLPARRMLIAIFGPVYLLGAVFFGFMAVAAKRSDVVARNTWIGFASFCALLAVVALIDYLVVRARIAEEQRAGLGWRHDRPWVVRGDVVSRADAPAPSAPAAAAPPPALPRQAPSEPPQQPPSQRRPHRRR